MDYCTDLFSFHLVALIMDIHSTMSTLAVKNSIIHSNKGKVGNEA